jgi:hypothetical protein
MKKKVIDKIDENYKHLYDMFGFSDDITGWQYFRQLIVDGFLAFEIIYDDSGKKIIGFKELDGRGFVVGTHNENISTTWNIPYKGDIVDNTKVLLQVGAYDTPPIEFKPSRRVRLRKIYNKLPCKGLIRYIYKLIN